MRAAEALRTQLQPATEGDGEPSGGSSEESVADSNASDSHEEDSSSDSDSDSGDDYDSAESDDSADFRLVADYTGAVDDSRFCDRCRAWGGLAALWRRPLRFVPPTLRALHFRRLAVVATDPQA